jgi:hypothetical protein
VYSFTMELMKRDNSKSLTCATILGCTVLLLGFAGPVYCENDGTALLLQITPPDGGTVNIPAGVHLYDRDVEVTLTATPKGGYQFVCWQGGVNDAASSNTLVFLDSPKIVIAVFERSKFDLMELAEEEPQPSVGGGRLLRSGGDYGAALEQAIGGKRPSRWHRPKPPEEEKIKDNIPVPEKGTDLPVPEPATALYFLFSISYLRKRVERHFRRIENRKQ